MFQVLDFNLHLHAFGPGLGLADCFSDADPLSRQGNQVVVLDDDAGCQIGPVILSPGDVHSVFFQQPQPGQGLAGIADFDVHALHSFYILRRGCCHSGQMRQEIKGHPLRLEYAGNPADHRHNHVPWLGPGAIGDWDLHLEALVDLHKSDTGNLAAAYQRRFLGDNRGGAAHTLGDDQFGGAITAAEIFGQGNVDYLLDLTLGSHVSS